MKLLQTSSSSLRLHCRAIVLASLAALLPAASFGSHNLLANGSFDSGVDGWLFETGSGASLSWDPAESFPSPGSLAIEGSFAGTGDVLGEALSECFEIPSGHQLELHARVLPEISGGTLRCQPYVTAYQLPGCAGNRTLLGGGGLISGQTPGVWQAQSSTFTTSGGASYRVALALWLLTGDGPATCHFDSVVFAEEGAASAVEVPAASPAGRWVLIAGLLGAAAWLLRHVREA